MTTPSDDVGRPLVDKTVLDRLREELEEDEEYCRIFVGNFIDYLPHRVGRLRLALAIGDLDASVDAVLSLKTSSQMVGAERLAGLAMALEGEIRSGSQEADTDVVLPKLAISFLRRISECSQQTMNRLQDQGSPGASL